MREEYMKKLCALVMLLVLILLILTGCYSSYSGEHVNLFTVAIHSVLWNNGHSMGADFVRDSEINILDEDHYGRILFTYYESYYLGTDFAFSALIICQSSNEQYVLYYEDVNFTIKEQVEGFSSPAYEFTNEEIEQLKLLNDWNTPLNLEKCIKKEITTQKPSIPHETELENIITAEFQLEERDGAVFVDFLTYDSNKNNYIVYGYVRDYPTPKLYFVGLVNIEDDQIKDVYFLQVSDFFNYQSEFVEFKKAHSWQ